MRADKLSGNAQSNFLTQLKPDFFSIPYPIRPNVEKPYSLGTGPGTVIFLQQFSTWNSNGMQNMTIISTYAVISDGNPDAKRLYDEILSGYNKLVNSLDNNKPIFK